MSSIVRSKPDDRVIYHYCDTNALLSILTNNKLWYTHAAYLNDTMEITRGVDICRSVIEGQLKSTDDPVLQNAKSYLQNAEKWQYYICCFSEAKDRLSQWRSYASDGDGFAIGFSSTELSVGIDDPFEGRLNTVQYEDDLLQKTIEELVGRFATTAHEFPDGTTDEAKDFSYENSGARLGDLLIDKSVFVKDKGFAEEEEWRSVRSYKLRDIETDHAKVASEDANHFDDILHDLQHKLNERRNVRSGRFGLTPYIEVSFRPNSIREIVCGPKTSKKLTESSLEILKKKLGLEFRVSRSTVTYR